MRQTTLSGGPTSITVTELARAAKRLIEGSDELTNIVVRGEMSNYRGPHASGHLYFSLKDENATVDCVMWRSDAAGLAFDPEEGMEVEAKGSCSLYEARGKFQLYVRSMAPAGVGDLALQLQLLKARLEKEGLFDEARKRPLPPFPRVIGVVTSRQGAALRDVLHVLGRRSPHVDVVLAHSAVQGAGAAAEVAASIERLNAYAADHPLDAIVVCRGGGSLEDLWAFNEEVAVRAVAASRVPVVAGVGHETDWTLADLAADVRAPTPSAAAEIVARSRSEMLELVDDHQRDLAVRLAARLRLDMTRLTRLADRPVLRRPDALFASAWQTTDELSGRLPRAVRGLVERSSAALAKGAATLDALSPLKVLGRGYAVALADGVTVRSVHNVKTGDALAVRVSDGTIETTVETTTEARE